MKQITFFLLALLLCSNADAQRERRVHRQPSLSDLRVEQMTIEEYPVWRFLGLNIRIGKKHRLERFYDQQGNDTLYRIYQYDEEHHTVYDAYGNPMDKWATSISNGAKRGTRYQYNYLYDTLGNISTQYDITLHDTLHYTYTFYPDSSVVDIQNCFRCPKHSVYDVSGNLLYDISYTRNGTPQVFSVQPIPDERYALMERNSLDLTTKSVLYYDSDIDRGYHMYKYTYVLRPWADCLQSGDLLFVSDTSDMGQAVKESTGMYTHVALVERMSDSLFIIDATQKHGVSRRPIEETFAYKMPIEIYRMTIPFDTATVITRAKSLLGKPYDNAFLPDNDAYYCSELIQVAYDTLFSSAPMNWRDKEGNLPEYWKKHFEKLGIHVPEGVPGTNPTDMSHSKLLRKL